MTIYRPTEIDEGGLLLESCMEMGQKWTRKKSLILKFVNRSAVTPADRS